jgi:hypothetical protein
MTEPKTSWCGFDCGVCQDYHCKRLRATATPERDQIVRERIYVAGGNIDKLGISHKDKKWCVRMLKHIAPLEDLSRGEEGILQGVHINTLRNRGKVTASPEHRQVGAPSLCR